jgi:alpha-beta hydrolase superfamily lysophospholipase
MTRVELRIPSGDGELAAWLYHPENGERPGPCVILAHGLTATREDRLWAFAERFAEAGIAALAFDYRHLGESTGEPRHLVDIKRQYADWDAAISCAAKLDGIDPRRIALWATSFSGGHVIDVAVRHPQVAAAIALVPFTDGMHELPRIPLRRRLRLLTAALRDEARQLRGAEPYYIPVGAPTGGFAILGDDGAWEGMRATVGERSLWRNEICARFSLQVATHRPIRNASRVACPLLIQIAEFDTVIHNAPAIRAAAVAPRGELRRYPTLRHFDGYTGHGFELVITDEIEFLQRHLIAHHHTPIAKETAHE